MEDFLVRSFTRWGNIGGATVVWDDNGVGLAVMVVEGDVEFVSKSVDQTSADSKTGKGAGARKEGDSGEVMPSFLMEG